MVHLRRMLALAMTVGCVAAAMVALPGASSADSGFCGVRVQGPTYVPGTFSIYAYTIRNKCGSGHHFRVHLVTAGRYTVCQYVGPYAYQTYNVGYESPTWTVVTC